MNPLPAIFLIGFMGSGKTTFGKKLAAKLKREFVDLDEAICISTEFPSIKELVDEKGFDFFRQAESDTLKALFLEDKVISTGGGTPCYFDNLEWMKSRGVVVFLNVEEGIIYSRLKHTDVEERPMLKNKSEQELKTFIQEKLKERMPFYSQAHIEFNPVKEEMAELIQQLSNKKS